jgi:hypothetical protein
MSFERRTLFRLAAAVATAAALPWRTGGAAEPSVEVWKSPTCGCCGKWIDHLTASGFAVTAHDVGNLAGWRAKHGMPTKYASCHTARVGGYTLEGHVPAREIRRLLAERPDAVGLAVPGMPTGSPGMEVDNVRDAYDVMLVLKDGSARSFAHYPAAG